MNSSSLKILGISASHDESACVMIDGRVEVAIQLERVTRKKHDGQGFLHTRKAADYCLQALGLCASDIDVYSFNAQPLTPNYVGLNVPSHDLDFDLFDPFSKSSVFVSHHLAHAFAAFYCSPFDDATVFVADGSGGSTIGENDLLMFGPELKDYLSLSDRTRGVHVTSTYSFNKKGFNLHQRETAATFNTMNGSSSIGETYSAVSQFIFGSWQDTGKLMGLAPYGNSENAGLSYLREDEHGRLQFDHAWKNQFRQVLRPKNPLDFCDLAARIQTDAVSAIVQRVRSALECTGIPRLAYSGGLALNINANQRLINEVGLDSLYILPASNDAGNAIGAAAAAHYKITKEIPRSPPLSDYLGRAYSQTEIDAAIALHTTKIYKRAATFDSILDLLHSEKIIGWFDGGSEFGPRALGHRSILAAPNSKIMWYRINRYVKHREDFRPFAPIIPLDRANEFFEIERPSPYMQFAVKVRETKREKLAAITHVDGTARVQTLARHANPRLYDLLVAYGERTGIPILINTSLNVRGSPIAEAPLEAIELLLSTNLDALVIGDHLLQTHSINSNIENTCFSLSPNVELRHVRSHEKSRYYVVAAGRGESEFDLPEWAYHLLCRMEGSTTLRKAYDSLVPRIVSFEDASKLCRSLAALLIILPNYASSL